MGELTIFDRLAEKVHGGQVGDLLEIVEFQTRFKYSFRMILGL